MKKQIVLAYSGGLDTSAIIPWLIEKYDAEIIAYCSDLGNAPDGKMLEIRARELGASKFIFEDLKCEFAERYVYPMVRAGAVYEDGYLLGTAIARPLISERVAHYAKEFNAFAIAHGATGKGNDQLRFERSWAYLAPEIKVVAPWKIWDFKGRTDLVSYLNHKGFSFSDKDKEYSVDVNLLHRSCEGGILEEVEKSYNPENVYEWVTPPSRVTGGEEKLTLFIENGMVRKINGKSMSADNILSELNVIGGKFGIGVVDLVEDRANGVKSRGVYETPGGTILYKAVNALKQICWNRQTQGVARKMSDEYALLVYDGLWHSDVRKSIDAFFEDASKKLTGEIKLVLKNGQIMIDGRISNYSLYDGNLVSFENDMYELNNAAHGFCTTLSYTQMQSGKVNNKFGIS